MTTEAEVLANIVEWSANIPAWQRDALRRLATQETLKPEEINELIAICKNEAPENPLKTEHFRSTNNNQQEVYLRRIQEVSNINALASDQRLTFHRTGLTIIYGDNGSGKSSYARILKKACRARTPKKIDDIKPNIYDSNPGIPSATIEYSINEQNRSYHWKQGAPLDSALSNISIFDAQTAAIHVDEENDVAYTPFPLKLLGELAKTCKTIKDKLNEEIEQIKNKTPESIRKPACEKSTSVGRFMENLTDETTLEEINSLITLEPKDEARLNQLTTDLTRNPEQIARHHAALKTKIEKYIANLDQLFSSTNKETFIKLQNLASESESARLAAKLASEELFHEEPLPKVGSEVWKILWDSARKFSESEAYPGQRFPVTMPKSVCVLCQQTLTPIAAARLDRFEFFIRNDSQKKAQSASLRYNQELIEFKRKAISIADLSNIMTTIRNELDQDSLAENVRKSILQALWRHRYIMRHHQNPKATIDASIIEYPRPELNDQALRVQEHVKALSAEANSPARTALVRERSELADRQWLKTIKEDVLAEIERKKRIRLLEKSLSFTTSSRITRKSTEIAQILVTDTLRKTFSKEVDSFHISGLSVELQQHQSTQGIPRFKVTFKNNTSAALGKVLSEGEHRCVALAAFMAELSTTNNKSSIVLDDPVSSLDHMHREAVAKRLATESTSRQVVLFTHDLAFLFALTRAAEDIQPKPSVNICAISRGIDKAGICRNEPPFKARKVGEITRTLRNKLKKERYHSDNGDTDSWRTTVKSISADIRDAWEIAVEESVGHVIRRLSNEVKTAGLVKLTAITIDDCEIMRNGFRRCSEVLHSATTALNSPLPTPEELEKEIDILEKWAEDIRNRQSATKLH